MKPPLLILDTSAARGACALANANGDILAATTWSTTGGHAEQILTHLQSLLADHTLAVSALGGVVVNIGPGSFTGVRAAVATAKALSMAPGLPVVGVDALAALAMTDPSPQARIALLDAHRNDLFVAVHAADGAPLVAPALVTAVAIGALFDAHPDALIVASAEVLHTLGKPGISPSDDDRLASLARRGVARLVAGNADDAAAMEPLYVRPPDLSLPKARRA